MDKFLPHKLFYHCGLVPNINYAYLKKSIHRGVVASLSRKINYDWVGSNPLKVLLIRIFHSFWGVWRVLGMSVAKGKTVLP